jgi:hypothetical protein
MEEVHWMKKMEKTKVKEVEAMLKIGRTRRS